MRCCDQLRGPIRSGSECEIAPSGQECRGGSRWRHGRDSSLQRGARQGSAQGLSRRCAGGGTHDHLARRDRARVE
jgi:hypothetical protein